jgi:hypothetical protein
VVGLGAEQKPTAATVDRVSGNLTELREALVAEIVQAGASKPTQETPCSLLTGSSQCLPRLNRRSSQTPMEVGGRSDGLAQIDLRYSYSATLLASI